ncbi:IS21-like element helper ATPase IstB [Paraburkholderia mimosarum]|uniref:IS21-like element helper ATPase IstB n=2 Tax=Paraburkholderia mimosarum TaxID=312026 RepID=UPI001591DC1B|nr:IS21-like element helper ATPase IstB [Paraburkholderia mimosarum]
MTKTERNTAVHESEAATDPLRTHLAGMHMSYVLQHYEDVATEAAAQHWSHVDYLAHLIEGEAQRREDRSIARRVALARFPVLKTLDQFEWNWPTRINRLQIQNLFRLNFIEEQANVIFLGGVGLGKTHLSIALGHTACLRGHSVLFATAVDIINSLNAAYVHGGLKRELRRYVKPRVLIVDELGYLPVDKQGADALFQIISQRYEHGPTIISSNRAFKHWAEIFNHDSTLTSALLDRLLHHAETVVIEGKSYRMKDQEGTDPATL